MKEIDCRPYLVKAAGANLLDFYHQFSCHTYMAEGARGGMLKESISREKKLTRVLYLSKEAWKIIRRDLLNALKSFAIKLL